MENITTGNLAILMVIIVNLGLCAMVFGIVYLHKRERMAMIERGMDPRRYKQRVLPYLTLKCGLLLIGAGLGLFLAYTLDRTLFKSAEDDNNAAIYFALITFFGGLGLFTSFLIEKRDLTGKKEQE